MKTQNCGAPKWGSRGQHLCWIKTFWLSGTADAAVSMHTCTVSPWSGAWRCRWALCWWCRGLSPSTATPRLLVVLLRVGSGCSGNQCFCQWLRIVAISIWKKYRCTALKFTATSHRLTISFSVYFQLALQYSNGQKWQKLSEGKRQYGPYQCVVLVEA